LAVFGPKFLPLVEAWKSHLFIGGGRGTPLLFYWQISALGSTRKHSNHYFKEAMMNCHLCAGKWLVRLATLWRCLRRYSLDQEKLFTLGCSQVSGYRFSAGFI
jgi:hypothetical protein